MKGLVLTYLLVYLGAPIALVNPFVGVCIYWLLDIVRPQYMFAWAGTEGSFSQIVAVATIIGWAFKGFGSWQFGRGRLLVLLFVASGCWSVMSAIAAPNQDVALTFLQELAKRSTMFLIAVSLADTPARVKALAWVIAGSAGYLALELNVQYLGGFNAVKDLGYGGMDNNSTAIMLVTCLGPALFLGLYSNAWWQKGLAFGSAALIAHTVLLTFSRGGILGLVVAGVAAIFVIPKRPAYLLAVVFALMLGLRFAGPEVRERFDSSFAEGDDRDVSAQSRLDLWRDCFLVMQRYPLFGAGPNHFALISSEFGWPQGKEAHSLWLQLGAEIGIPGMILLVSCYLLTMKRMLRLARNRLDTEPDRWAQHAACAVVTSLGGFIVSAQFVTMEGLETPLYIVAIGVGALRLMNATAEARAPQPVPAAVVDPWSMKPPRHPLPTRQRTV